MVGRSQGNREGFEVSQFLSSAPARRKSSVVGVRSPGTPAIACSFALAVGAAAFALSETGSVETRLWTAVLGSVAVGAGALVAVNSAAKARGWIILTRLGPATIVLYTLSFGVFGLAWLSPQTQSRLVIDPAQIPPAIAVSMIGLIALTVGYLLGPPGVLTRSAQSLVAKAFPVGPWSLRVPSIAVLLYLTGTAARAFRLSTGQYGYLQDASQTLASPSPFAQALSMVESLTTIALVVAAIDFFVVTRSTRARFVLAVFTASEVFVGFSSASKQQVLFTLTAVALVKVLSGQRIRVLRIVPVVVLVSLLFPFVSDYRSTIRGGDTGQIAATTALAEVPAVIRRTFDSVSIETILRDGPSSVAQRLRQIDNIAVIRQKTPALIPYQPWTLLVAEPLVLGIPRAVWPSKPVIATGLQFAQDYYEQSSSQYSAAAVTYPGDLYRHGGVAPLLVGMTLLGLILRLVERALSPSNDARHLIVFVPVFLHLIKLESGVAVYLVTLAQLSLLGLITSWLVFTPSRRRTPATHDRVRAALASG